MYTRKVTDPGYSPGRHICTRSGSSCHDRNDFGAAFIALLLACAGATATGAPATNPLQSRIDNAPAGSTIEIEPGTYAGPLVVDKPITLIGRDWPVIDGERAPHVVRIAAEDVHIEGFDIRGSGSNLSNDNAGIFIAADRAVIRRNRVSDALHGIYIRKANDCRIEANTIAGKTTRLATAGDVMTDGFTPAGGLCTVGLGPNQRGNGIHLWNSLRNIIDGNTISETRDGIYFSFSRQCQVRANTITHTRYGLHYMYSDQNVFEGNTFRANAAGAAMMYSKGLWVNGNRFENNLGRRAYGLIVQAVDDSVLTGNNFEGNTVGHYLENSNGNTFARNAIASNYIGVRLTVSSENNVFTRNRLAGNLHPVEIEHEGTGNAWAASGVGNFWSGTGTMDLDGDGIGELPHRECDFLGRHRRAFPLVGLLTANPGLQLLRFVQERVRIPGLPGIEDPAPLATATIR